MRQITDYNKVKIISKDESLNQKKFYCVNTKNGKNIVTLTDGLVKVHFLDKLYVDVTKGSKRWWVLERRKFDYNKFYSKKNQKVVTKKIIETHESEWKTKVDNFYSELQNGYVESSSIGNHKKVPSKYMLSKYSDGNSEYPISEVKRIGLDENNEPRFYRIIIDNNEEVDVECKVSWDDIKYEPKCKRLSQRWWTLERMKFDHGLTQKPLLKGQKPGDWKGVKEKFDYSFYPSNNHKGSFKDYQEESWNRYVDSLILYLKQPHKEITLEEKIRHNSIVISKMTSDKIMEITSNYPMIIFRNLPSYLYQKVLFYIIEESLETRRLIVSYDIYNETSNDIIKSFKNIVSHFKYVDIQFSDKIDFEVVKSTLRYNPNEYSTFFHYLIYQSIYYEMVSPQFVNTLLLYINRFKFKNEYISISKKDELEDQLQWFRVDKPSNSIFDRINEIENEYENFCQENDLYCI